MSLMVLFLKWKTSSLNRNKAFLSSLYSVFTYLKHACLEVWLKNVPLFVFLSVFSRQIFHTSTTQNLHLWVFDCNRSAAEWMRKTPTFVRLNGWNKGFVLLKCRISISLQTGRREKESLHIHQSVNEGKKKAPDIFLKRHLNYKIRVFLDSSSIVWGHF